MAKIEVMERWETSDGKQAIRVRLPQGVEIHYINDGRYFIINPCLAKINKAQVLKRIKGML